MEDLPIDQLRTFATIAETTSFTQAAEKLYRTQPALSLQIKRLEERVGATLLIRNGRKVTLTEVGQVLLDYAHRILELNEEALARISVTETEGKVSVGVLEEVAIGPLVDLLTKFGRLCSKVQLELHVDTSWELARRIKSNELCLAVANNQYAGGGATPLWHETYVWAANPSYDLLNADSIPLVLEPADYACVLREQAIEALKAVRKPWHVAFSSYSLTALQAAVRAGLGLGLLAESALTTDIHPIATDLLPSIEPATIALYRGEEAKSSAVDTLFDFLLSHLQTPGIHQEYPIRRDW